MTPRNGDQRPRKTVVCPQCGYEAPSRAQLRSHRRDEKLELLDGSTAAFLRETRARRKRIKAIGDANKAWAAALARYRAEQQS